MSKLKTLREARASVFKQIDDLRTATDGREMTCEEEARWQQLLTDYDKADKSVEAEERFEEIERRQAEQQFEERTTTTANASQPTDEYRAAFQNYLLRGASGISPEHQSLF